MKLRDKHALITGAGSGIGRAIARLFHANGAEVWINDIVPERTLDVSSELGLPNGRALVADVSDSEAVSALFDRLETLDVLVNNAGIAETEQRWAELNRTAEAKLAHEAGAHWDVTVSLSDLDWRRMIAVHLDATFFCTREALRKMSARGRGVIVNLSSTAALAGLPDAPHYAAAKAGVLGFTRSLAREVASRGVRVNAIAPGFVDTPMTAHVSTRVKEQSLAQTPMGRWASPDEIAEAALFLASDDSSYVTGQCLSPNGGAFM
jgi:3-oxoacyl-[acyl-carrier protein] reductase